MNLPNDISLYLPKYLSDESTKVLLEALQEFPSNINQKFYTAHFSDTDVIFQGDGMKGFQVINLPSERIDIAPVLVLSNTCDIDLKNKRDFPSQISYAPLLNLNKYKTMLEANGKSAVSVEDHLADVRKQKITQMLYLPMGSGLTYEAIVFLDRINNCDNKSISRKDLYQRRLFVLSDYGFYLFLIKVSFHFTRIQEKIDRNKGVIL